jgi:1-acyl-sn-glycerol-3-phosphate acyltransferase
MSQTEKKLDYKHQPSRAWYRIARGFFGILFHTLWPLRIKGWENVPREGAAIIVCNHLSMVDPFVVSYGAHRLINFMGKQELFRLPFVGFIIRKLGAFPVNRSQPDPRSTKIALRVLDSGELLGMFPEGTRNTKGTSSTGEIEMQELRTGAAMLAARKQVPVIPVALHGTDRAQPRGKFVRPARISVIFGEPFELAELYGRNTKGEAMERALNTIKERIESLHEVG